MVSPHVMLCGEASGEAARVLFCCPDNSAGADAMKSGVCPSRWLFRTSSTGETPHSLRGGQHHRCDFLGLSASLSRAARCPVYSLAESVPHAATLVLGELCQVEGSRTSADWAWEVGLDVGGAVTSLSKVTASGLCLRRV